MDQASLGLPEEIGRRVAEQRGASRARSAPRRRPAGRGRRAERAAVGRPRRRARRRRWTRPASARPHRHAPPAAVAEAGGRRRAGRRSGPARPRPPAPHPGRRAPFASTVSPRREPVSGPPPLRPRRRRTVPPPAGFGSVVPTAPVLSRPPGRGRAREWPMPGHLPGGPAAPRSTASGRLPRRPPPTRPRRRSPRYSSLIPTPRCPFPSIVARRRPVGPGRGRRPIGEDRPESPGRRSFGSSG